METGRFFVVMKSGRKFCVEPWGYCHTQFGNIDPATKKLEIVRARETEVIDESNTVITKENGYKNICITTPGTSPIGYIDALDTSGLERIECEFIQYLD